MGLGITKKGNLYNKANAGKAIGAAGGAAIGYKFLAPKIKQLSSDMFTETIKDTVKNGGYKSLVQDLKFLKNVSKYSKPIGAALTAVGLFILGKAVDDNVNLYRQNKADKQAEIKNQQ